MSPESNECVIRRLGVDDQDIFHGMLTVFAEAFDERDTYNNHRPDPAYISDLLQTDTFIALAALHNHTVVGALAAYELRKFEQKRSEIYIYDLAVDAAFRRRGIAKALLAHMTILASTIGAHAVFVQADPEDDPAVRLYDSLGQREEVYHYDLRLAPRIP